MGKNSIIHYPSEGHQRPKVPKKREAYLKLSSVSFFPSLTKSRFGGKVKPLAYGPLKSHFTILQLLPMTATLTFLL